MATLKMSINGSTFKAMGEDSFITKQREAFMDAVCDRPGACGNIELYPTADVAGCILTASTSHYALGMAEDWDRIIDYVKNGNIVLRVGDTITFYLNTDERVELVVTADEPDRVRLESRDCVGGCTPRNIIDEHFEKIWNAMPEQLRNGIMEVERKYLKGGDGELVTEKCNLFLPSASEVFEPDECYGDKGVYKQMEWYKDRRNRIRLCVDDDGDQSDCWWLLSAYAGNSTFSAYVGSNGNASYTDATASWVGAPVCFYLSKS